MSQVEELLSKQDKIATAIETLYVNFKKDGAGRKTPEYIQRRLDSLEDYWSQFNNNHRTLVDIGEVSLHYFSSDKYGQVQSLYQKIRDVIRNYLPSRSSEEAAEAQRPMLEPPTFVAQNPQQQDTAASSKTEDMLKKQLSNFKAYMRTTSNIDLELVSEKWEFEDLLRTIQARWSAIDKLHWELDSEWGVSNKEYEQEYSKYESHYNNLKKFINKKMWSVAHIEKTTPKMDIPIFTGSYSQWIPFKDLFTETIHRNLSLSDAQKLQFLKSKLRGEPEKLIQHLQISSSNYSISWSILTNRYDNMRLIFSAHANTLLNIPSIQQQSANGIKRIHDVTNECLNAIMNLDIDTTSWDPLLVHILSQKLDSDTYQDYMESVRQPRAIPNLKEFLDFLENKFTSLESSRRKQDSIQKSSSNNQYQVSGKHTSNTYQKPNYYKSSFSSSTRVIPSNNTGTKSNYFTPNKYWCVVCNNNEHGIYFCQKFLNLPSHIKKNVLDKHNLCYNCLYSHHGYPCKSDKRCKECNKQHNSVLHEVFQSSHVTPRRARPETSSTAAVTGQQASTSMQMQGSSHVSLQGDPIEVLLPTAMIKIKAADGSYHVMRALLDQGSQASLITENAAQILKLPRQKCRGVISGVGAKENSCKGIINIQCMSTVGDYTFETDVFIMKTLIKNLPNYTTLKPNLSYLDQIKLADPEFYKSRPVDLLLGADVYGLILMDGICRDNTSLPTAQQTRLGWILSGNTKTIQCNVVLNDLSGIERFWETEDITDSSELSMEDQQCMQYYEETTIRRNDGRYEVRIPFKANYQDKIGESKHKARAQFYNLERKFERQPEVAKQYKSFINEYLSLGHMTLEANDQGNSNMKPSYYLPHHCVQRDDSTTTKLRVVFNASAKTSSGFSLNDIMCRGPNLQQDLQNLIIKWRQYKYAYTADIEKMFRQIWVNPLDQGYQKIIWRDERNQQIKEYQLATVTYGTKAAPFLAMMTLKKLARDERPNYENNAAPDVLESSFYMDDLLHGSHSETSAKKLQKDLIKLLSAGGFNLRKWNANTAELLDDVSSSQEFFDFKQVESTKTLGLGWNPMKDTFLFQSKIASQTAADITKRILLSEISKLYDPLGWISPITIKLKILFQDVWKAKIQWDEPIPDEIKGEWNKIKNDLTVINEIEIPRWLQTKEHDTIELHGFSDASTKAYGCVVYCKIKTEQGSSVVLVAGKTKLVSIDKNTSLPRLELNGALLLSKLMAKIMTCLNNYNIKIFGWVDSMAVLGWLNGDVDKWKPYVSNRVKQVTAVIPPICWRYVKSKENPADCASRGLTASQLKDHELWWHGPAWLPNYDPSKAETQQFSTNLEVRKCKQTNVAVIENIFVRDIVSELLVKQSSLNKAIRILAWIYRSIFRKNADYLSVDELTRARNIIIKQNQAIEFYDEISCLRQGKPLNNRSKILCLNPLLDNDGLLRVGGRLRHANINPEMKHPLIIPNNRLAELIIDQAHQTTFHGGAKLTTSFIRQKYWLLGGYRAVKKRLRLCVTCKKQNPRKVSQIMGDLPPSRVNPSRPFFHTGIDYTGHVFIKSSKGRGIKTTKGYVAVFICMATKAVHLELVSDMTSSTFLAALRRFSARRGVPGHLYSDQGTNFVGANKVLQQEYEEIRNSFSQQECVSGIANMGINWHFNAPSWPSGGGLWEAAVKSVKYHLKRVIGEQRLTYEEFGTLLTQIEGCLNSRPLCGLSEDPEDLNFLTPSHFLGSGPLLTIYDTEKDQRTRWQLVQKIINDLWERWRREYLTQLSSRSKWRQGKENIKIGDIVVIQDDNLPPGQWALGRVVTLHPGCDDYIRVVTLKTKNGFIKRPVVKLSILTSSEKQEDIQQTDQETPRKKRSCNSFTKIAMSLLLLFTMIAPSSQSVYNITILTNNNSLYFDSITNMHLIRDNWRLVLYYNTRPYQEGNTTLRKYIEYLEKLCPTIKMESHCAAIILQLRHEFRELQHNNNILINYQSNTISKHRRSRGLINGVGYLANSLFGVLDDHFAEKYEKDIATIKSNENHLAALWKNQTSVVEAEFNLLKRTEDTMEQQHKLIHQKLNFIDTSLNQVKEGIQNLSLSSDFIETAMIANNLLFCLRRIQLTLLDTITNIYNGKFNFQLLSPEQLRHELNIISGQLPKDLSSPIDNFNLAEIYNLLQVRTRMTQKFLIIEIKIPLIGRDTYEVFRLIPIPYLSGNQVTTIVPIADYAAINLNKDAVIPVTERDLQQCTQQNINLILCHLKTPIYHFKDDQSLCEIIPGTRICKTTRSPCSNHWQDLNKLNEYFYFCCDRCHTKLLCEDQVTAVVLEGTGLFTIHSGCIIKSADFFVYAHKSETSKIQINSDIEAPIISPINHMINVSIPTYISSEQEPNSSKQFEEIRQQIDIMKENMPGIESVSTHDVHHYTAIYIIMGIILLAAIMYLVKELRMRRQHRQQETVELSSARQPPPGVTAAATAGCSRVAEQKPRNECSQCAKCEKGQSSDEISNLSEVIVPPKTSARILKQNRATSPVLRSVFTISEQ